MKYIDANELLAEIDRKEVGYNTDGKHAAEYDTCKKIIDIITSLQQEQQDVDLDKLVNEEFASHCRTTIYGLEVTYNRAELYQLIKRMALVFNARKEDKI